MSSGNYSSKFRGTELAWGNLFPFFRGVSKNFQRVTLNAMNLNTFRRRKSKCLEQHLGVSGLALSWFKSYVSNKFQFVSASGSNSQLCKLHYGVPQESVLGPVLFVLYARPLSQILFNHSCPHQFFADDTQLRKSCSPEHYDDIRNALQTCIFDIKD